jgi:peroxiredoxin
LAGFEAKRAELEALGVSVHAASIDTGEKAAEVAGEVAFPVGAGVSRATAETVGAWWEERRGIVQPSQFVFRRDGTIVQSTYSDGPLGRLQAEDVVRLVNFLNK